MTTEKRVFPHGIHGFPVAPFTAEGKLDMDALERTITFLIEEGLQSIFIACGSSEFHAVSTHEYKEMLETAVSVADGRVPVYSGVGGNISHALELGTISAQVGVDGYLILPPYLVQGEQEGLYHYFKMIATNTDLDAIIYQRDNAVFQVETVMNLAEIPQIIGFKDGYGNVERNIELTQTIGDRLEWFNGMPFAEITMPVYHALGYRSYSSAMSNYLPHISRLFYQALLNGDQKRLSQLYREVILPINRIRKQRNGYAVALIKAGMEIVGLPVGKTVRPPLTVVEPEHYAELETIIQHALENFPKEEALTE
ncbi:5-dehydro-4-deoxyglucarate dehydratase [Desmospora activa]|uniref:Probable 5-dehydro-4-deoxyglucarate dehydratase n=1 Tax=Desmospora activa DSM 45169 TaxID=1121389 RepID=A0A2T4Z7Z5_9BACL|nr:5-dehydro-4-deoxyglucarate dehydratase [Desmospora activa]PTM58016.1 5-dehydro-4-deoxyglucarate dehydratase [Desmospora activa DSM 45169]